MREHNDDEPTPGWVQQPQAPDSPRLPSLDERELEEIDRLLLEDQEIPEKLHEWLRENGVKARHVIAMERIRDEEAVRRKAIHDWAVGGRTKTRAQIARWLIEQHGVTTYDRLEELLGVTRRTARKYVLELKDMRLVEVRGNPASIVVPDDMDYLLLADVVDTSL